MEPLAMALMFGLHAWVQQHPDLLGQPHDAEQGYPVGQISAFLIS